MCCHFMRLIDQHNVHLFSRLSCSNTHNEKYFAVYKKIQIKTLSSNENAAAAYREQPTVCENTGES